MPPAGPDRLRDGRAIGTVLRGRHRRAGRHVALHHRTRDTDGDQTTRVAVVASKRVGNAVTRNRAKRVLREAARAVTWTGGVDVVLVARASAAEVSAGEVTDELRRLASEAGVVPAVEGVA